MYLDLARRIEQRDSRRHPSSKEFPGLQPVSIGLLYLGSHKKKMLLIPIIITKQVDKAGYVLQWPMHYSASVRPKDFLCFILF